MNLGVLNFFGGRDIWCGATNGGLKNCFFFFFLFFVVKVRSKELKIFNILRANELKLGPSSGCRTENSFNFLKISLTEVKIYYFCSKWGSKELSVKISSTADEKYFPTHAPDKNL